MHAFINQIQKIYPDCPQFFEQKEFSFNQYLPRAETSGNKPDMPHYKPILSIDELREAH